MRKRWKHLLDWLAFLWRPPLFVVRVRSGVAAASRGVVTSKFLVACAEVLRDHGIPACTIRGYRTGKGVSLGFSREIPDTVRQNLRNVWSVHL